MSSETDVCNTALGMLGLRRIQSYNDESDRAETCRTHLHDTRLELLEAKARAWKFALRRQKLARSTTIPAFQFKYYYSLPSDYIKVFALGEDPLLRVLLMNGSEPMYNIESHPAIGNCVASSREDLYLRYVADIQDVTLMPHLFRQAWASRLAERIALSLTSSTDLVQLANSQHNDVMRKAANAGSMEDYPTMLPDYYPNSWLAAYEGAIEP